ncbi:MAG: endonuclease V [Elusimicrobiota bacterium]
MKNKFETPNNIGQAILSNLVGRAKIIQRNLSAKVILKNDFKDISDIKTIAGCYVSYLPNFCVQERGSKNNMQKRNSKNENNFFAATAAVVVLDIETLRIVEKIKIKYRKKIAFPYIPDYLSFREGPALIEVIKKLQNKPDVFLFDGQGIAHPRWIGIASHLGVLLDKPSIGCAKSCLYGDYEEPPPALKGAHTFLKDDAGNLIGIVMRSKKYTKPIFISQGHKIDLVTASDIVFKCLAKYRIPEPLRLAHIEANKN